jgi:hypothetical protein
LCIEGPGFCIEEQECMEASFRMCRRTSLCIQMDQFCVQKDQFVYIEGPVVYIEQVSVYGSII